MKRDKKYIVLAILLVLLFVYTVVYFANTTTIQLIIPCDDIEYIDCSMSKERIFDKDKIESLASMVNLFRYYKKMPESITNEITFSIVIKSKTGAVERVHWASESVIHSYNDIIMNRYTLPISTFFYEHKGTVLLC